MFHFFLNDNEKRKEKKRKHNKNNLSTQYKCTQSEVIKADLSRPS